MKKDEINTGQIYIGKHCVSGTNIKRKILITKIPFRLGRSFSFYCKTIQEIPQENRSRGDIDLMTVSQLSQDFVLYADNYYCTCEDPDINESDSGLFHCLKCKLLQLEQHPINVPFTNIKY